MKLGTFEGSLKYSVFFYALAATLSQIPHLMFLCIYFMLTIEAVMAVQASLREDIVKLLIYSVNTPAPNIAHLLLGYDITKPLQETNLQDPGKHSAF